MALAAATVIAVVVAVGVTVGAKRHSGRDQRFSGVKFMLLNLNFNLLSAAINIFKKLIKNIKFLFFFVVTKTKSPTVWQADFMERSPIADCVLCR